MILLILAIIVGGFFYFRQQVYFSHGSYQQNKIFEIKKGEGNSEISANLKKEGLISGNWYFYYYVRSHGLLNKFLPGKYELNGSMTIPEIAMILTNEEKILPGYAKVTFPEGWTGKQMAERLKANGLDGDGFLALVQNPDSLREKYAFLKDKSVKTLEGYLFPDTYFLAKEIKAEDIIVRMLDNFDSKITSDLQEEMKNQSRSLDEIIIMASIIENEVRSDSDRALVSGIYWNRIKIGQPLQSDITLAYILGEKKKQYSSDDTRTVSPYNTYLNKGLPPGPIDNPGLSAIKAAIYPQDSDYNYYLSDPETGQTVFAKSFEEHKVNKAKYGL